MAMAAAAAAGFGNMAPLCDILIFSISASWSRFDFARRF
jgi:hypothetical protein